MSETPSVQLAELRQFIEQAVAQGFDAPERIAESAREYFADSGASDLVLSAVESLVADAMAAHLERQKQWELPTDCDRLDRAFEALEREGILARQHWACCQSCGHCDMQEEGAAQRQAGREVLGYAFFHAQDTESAAGGGGLFLAFSAAEEKGEGEIGIGHRVVRALEREGLQVEWDGTTERRIYVRMQWRRRR